jgi:predicted methyltransferase
VKTLLAPGGVYLVCDHYFGDDGMRNEQLYMSIAEQEAALRAAGFEIRPLLLKGGMALYRAS